MAGFLLAPLYGGKVPDRTPILLKGCPLESFIVAEKLFMVLYLQWRIRSLILAEFKCIKGVSE